MPSDEGRPNRWRVPFAFALATFAGSLVGLAAAVYSVVTESEPAAQLRPDGRSSGPAVVKKLRYSGELPQALDAGEFELADPGDTPDLSFQAAAPGEGVITRYFVPVGVLGLGVDALTSDELRQALAAPNSNARQYGGTLSRIQFAAAVPELKLVGGFSGGAVPVVTYPDETTMVQAMAAAPGSGEIGFVSLEMVRPAVMAVAVDGIDLVRGRGDAEAWPFVERVTVRARTKRGEAELSRVSEAIRARLPAATTLVATGDILQSRCTLAKIEAAGDWAAALRGPVGEYLAAADLTLGSLDGSIQDIGRAYRCVATTNLSSPPEVMAALTLAGFDEVTVATNHVFDCGEVFCGTRAFLRTLELLDAAGIRHVGGGVNLEAALAPVILEAGGIRVGVLGFDDVAAYELEATATAPGTAPLDDSYAEENAAGEPAFYRPASELSLTRFVERIRALKQEVDVVVVQVQSGKEDMHTPSPRSIKALRAAADAGADLVVGNQAHWVQAVEARGDGFIAYALGNFIFDQTHTPEHAQGFLLEANFLDKRLANVRLVPYQIVDQYRPEFAGRELRSKILTDVLDESAVLGAER